MDGVKPKNGLFRVIDIPTKLKSMTFVISCLLEPIPAQNDA